MLLMLHIHHSRANDLVEPDLMIADRRARRPYREGSATGAPASLRRRPAAALGPPRERHGAARPYRPLRAAHAVQDCPRRRSFPARKPVLRDRSADRNRLASVRQTPTGGGRVQAICDYVHRHIAFSYQDARSTKRHGRRSRRARACAATTRTWHRVLPLHEHSLSVLHGLSRRHRRPAPAPNGLRRMV